MYSQLFHDTVHEIDDRGVQGHSNPLPGDVVRIDRLRVSTSTVRRWISRGLIERRGSGFILTITGHREA
ncbi:hypothetical protein JCM15519_17030 [Fundidesulfovibrio butyratiphilus]